MLHLHTADRVGPLAGRLAEVLAVPPADPLAPEWIAVPSEGMRRWLSLELARHLGSSGQEAADGVAANLTPAFPGSLRTRILDAGRPETESGPEPWDVERLAWAVLAVLAQHPTDPLLAPLAETASGASRYSRSRRLADLFDRYHVHRPAMVRAWAAGADVDGAGRPLASSPDLAVHAWQPHLWRLVRAQVGTFSPPERLPDLLAQLRSGDLQVDLPDRLSLFGVSVLPGGAGFVELAQAVAATRDLHLFLLDPSPAASRAVAEAVAATPAGGPRLRSADGTAEVVGHPLLRSWGRLPRETAILLADAHRLGLPAPVAVSAPPHPPPTTLLARLQADLRAGCAPAGGAVVDPSDTTVRIHAAHGAARQVEVLRDAILGLLSADPSLQEDDIVVLCPALERFAPYVEAAFGPSSEHARQGSAPHGADLLPSLRYRIAERSSREADPVVAGLDTLLDLAVGRFDATAVLDLLAQPTVRQRFGLSDDDVARIDDWVGETQVRWGLDPDHRGSLGVPAALTANTWRAALDRLLIGAAVADDESGFSLGDVVPLGIEGDDVDLAGRLADLLGHLGRLAEATGAARPVGEWIELLGGSVAALLEPAPDQAWEAEVVHRALAAVLDHATGPDGPSPVELTFGDVRRLVRDQLAGVRGRPDFFRGGITVTALDPLRSIPHRVVCLLGMDQPAFVVPSLSSDDLMAAAPVVGDRDARAEVRQGLLEAVLAAGEHLVIVREGHDLRTNQEVPPAVVVVELLEAIGAVVGGPADAELLAAVQVAHPRQPFDERCFTAGALAGPGPWSFDPGALAGAVARRSRVTAMPPLLASPLPAAAEAVIDLADLRRFLDNPIQRFVDGRLQVALPRDEDARPTRLPVALTGLDRWKVGDRLLQTLLADGDVERWERVERQLGTLPPGSLGTAKVAEIVGLASALVEAARAHDVRSGPPDVLPVDLELPDGTRIVGSVAGRIRGAEPGPALVGYGSQKPKHGLGAWLDLAALTATDPANSWRAVTVHARRSRTRDPAEVSDLVLAGEGPERLTHALESLAVIVDCYRRGLREPLPIFPTLSCALYLEAAKPALWTSSGGFADRDDRFVTLAYGHLDYADLLTLPARPDDPPGEGARVLRYATYLYGTQARTCVPRLAAGATAAAGIGDGP
ncbi:MAG: exodeoxyribonuclease subunit gamma [Acidimicrobiales bacterium]|nr:exodeoxyribonuclease subunit gamma [Acidimicrobiales bacterium]